MLKNPFLQSVGPLFPFSPSLAVLRTLSTRNNCIKKEPLPTLFLLCSDPLQYLADLFFRKESHGHVELA